MSSELLGAVYGLLSAVCYGSGDFTGGFNSKNNSLYAVVILSQFTGLILYLSIGLISGEVMPPAEDLVYAAIGGTIGLIGLLALYRSLSLGHMGVTAPIAGVITSALPVIFTAISQGLPDMLTLIGFAVGLVAVWLVAQSPTSGHIDRRAILLPIIAGTAFGTAFLFFVRGSENDTFFPLAAARTTTVILIGLFVLITRTPLKIDSKRSVLFIVLGGMLDSGGNAFFVTAAHLGRPDVAAVLSSMYPAATITLAALILKERIRRVQWIGIAAALIAILLIVA